MSNSIHTINCETKAHSTVCIYCISALVNINSSLNNIVSPHPAV